MDFKQLAMMEHWLYLASIGLFAILGYIFIKLYRRIPKATVLLFICLSIGWSILTIHYNSYGKDPVTFYKHILDYFPDNVPIRINLASALYPNNTKEAKRQFRIVLDAWDTWQKWTDLLPDSCFGPGKTYSSRADLDQELKAKFQDIRKLLEDK
jgi:glucan phosphoethanolaminetransferase (alkaline phosphatase superfamily)